MKILFIENRYKTFFFDLVACQLEKLGHEIFWIVQNPNFLPKTGDIKTIKFPPKFYQKKNNVDIADIINSDRQINYFKKKELSYFYYYYHEIEQIVEEIKPNYVFGESTAFHELLTIKICRDKEILFLHPTSCRYPAGRFSFYLYDTVFPYLGEHKKILKQDALSIIEKIMSRSSKPDYMKKTSFKKIKILKDKIKILKGYAMGERFNTPNPIVKYRIEKQKKNNIENWDKHSVFELDKNKFSVVYPMHLQPEANIDVWGRPKRDQLETIKKLSANLEGNQLLYVKPNPKSKYELSIELLKFINETKNVKMLHHSVSMDAIFNSSDLFITVNGTIALECIFSNKPVFTLVDVFFNKAKNCLFLKSFSDLQESISKIKTDTFPTLSKDEKVDFLNLLNATSYTGVISDPYYSDYSVSKENINNVILAFNHILNK
ncbi:glycosyltransferase [Pseudotamlana carrageenivorans]|nr:glycosyltransferase [Tamlana carrageenivorans]